MRQKTVFSFLWNTKYLTYQMVYSSLQYVFLSLDFVIDVFMTLETLVKFKGWNQDSSLGPEHAKPRYR